MLETVCPKLHEVEMSPGSSMNASCCSAWPPCSPFLALGCMVRRFVRRGGGWGGEGKLLHEADAAPCPHLRLERSPPLSHVLEAPWQRRLRLRASNEFEGFQILSGFRGGGGALVRSKRDSDSFLSGAVAIVPAAAWRCVHKSCKRASGPGCRVVLARYRSLLEEPLAALFTAEPQGAAGCHALPTLCHCDPCLDCRGRLGTAAENLRAAKLAQLLLSSLLPLCGSLEQDFLAWAF